MLEVDFTISPVDPTPLTYTVGGVTYPYARQADNIARGSDTRYVSTLTKTNTNLTFTATVIATEESIATEYRWDFGDGVIAFGPIATHTYLVAVPQMAVSLVVVDQHLNQYTRKKLLNIREGQRIVFGLPFRVTG